MCCLLTWYFQTVKELLRNHSSYAKFLKKTDDNDHIPPGNDYMVCNYLEKTFENV